MAKITESTLQFFPKIDVDFFVETDFYRKINYLLREDTIFLNKYMLKRSKEHREAVANILDNKEKILGKLSDQEVITRFDKYCETYEILLKEIAKNE